MKDDFDEARLPECVRKLREYMGTYDRATMLDDFMCERNHLSEAGEQIAEWLASAPPAILLAASAADAEVLRAEQEELRAYWDGGRWQSRDDEGQEEVARECSLARARIVDASTHVVLPRAEVEALFRSLARGEIYIDEFVGKFNRLSRETGKGEE